MNSYCCTQENIFYGDAQFGISSAAIVQVYGIIKKLKCQNLKITLQK
jgi:hypothetical protein